MPTDERCARFNESETRAGAGPPARAAWPDTTPIRASTRRTIAMDDLDDVRAFLGYDAINIYGGSYGTRAGLVYLRQHGDHVRSAIVLDGVAPTDMRLPLFFARDAQRALDKLLADCDGRCRLQRAISEPRRARMTRADCERLDKTPPTVRRDSSAHRRRPRTSRSTRGCWPTSSSSARSIRRSSSSLVPATHRPRREERLPGHARARVDADEAAASNMSVGMQLSVICAEDAPRNSTGEIWPSERRVTLFGKHLLAIQTQGVRVLAARQGGRVVLRAGARRTSRRSCCRARSIRSRRRRWGEQVAQHLSNSRHVIVPGTGHGAPAARRAGSASMRDFIEKGSPQASTRAASTRVKRPPFFLTPAGPDPNAAGTAPQSRRRNDPRREPAQAVRRRSAPSTA